MSVFVVLNDGWDEKTAIVHPDIVGPFDSDEEADAFIEAHPCWNGTNLEPWDGGYAAAHVISARTASAPDSFLREWDQLREETG